MLVTDHVSLAQQSCHPLVVIEKLGEHVLGGYVGRVIVRKPLNAVDVTDRSDRRAAELADALGDDVGRREYLVTLLVEQQMVNSEMRPGHVPMEVLGLEIKREHIG